MGILQLLFPTEEYRYEESGWRYITSSSFGITRNIDLPAGAGGSGGLGRGTFTVQVTQGMHARSTQYRIDYHGLLIGGGYGFSPPFTISLGREADPSEALQQVYRLTGSPDNSGEGGPPVGFLAPIAVISGGVTAGVSFELSGLLLGGDKRDFTGAQVSNQQEWLNALIALGPSEIISYLRPDRYKYSTIVRGRSWATEAGAGVSGMIGYAHSYRIV